MSLTVTCQVGWEKKALGFLCAVWATSVSSPWMCACWCPSRALGEEGGSTMLKEDVGVTKSRTRPPGDTRSCVGGPQLA